MSTYRTGRSWGVTIVREGHGEANPSNCGLVDDELVAVITNGDVALAERICVLLNGSTGPCSAALPHLFDTEIATWCELRHGHSGDHESGPTRWRVSS